jgi:hypothetical protein
MSRYDRPYRRYQRTATVMTRLGTGSTPTTKLVPDVGESKALPPHPADPQSTDATAPLTCNSPVRYNLSRPPSCVLIKRHRLAVADVLCPLQRLADSVKPKRYQKICDIIAEKAPGESVVAASYANIGNVSLGKQFAQAAATAVLTAGLLSVRTKPRPSYLVVTDHRLLILDASAFTGGPTKTVNFAIPFQRIGGVTEPKRGVATIVHLMIEGRDKALRIQFPRAAREDGDKVLQSLPVRILS